MLPYIFPYGTNYDSLHHVFDIKQTLNIREIPIAIKFPDWNDWLPKIHPMDMMSAKSYKELITGIGGVRSQRPKGTYGYKNVNKNLKENGLNLLGSPVYQCYLKD